MRPGCGVMFVWLIVLFVVSTLFELLFGRAGLILARIIFLGVGLWVVPSIVRDAREKRRRQAPPAEQVLQRDQRAPIVYLRSFKDDGTAREIEPTALVMPLISPYGAVIDQTTTFEEQLTGHLSTVGPCVALGRMKYELPELGAARIYAENDNWQEIVLDLMLKSRLVVFRAGDTQNLLWELGKIVECIHPTRVLVYLQIGGEPDPGVQQARYNKFRRLTESIFPQPLPTTRGKNQFLYFTSGWQPLLARDLRRALAGQQIPFERSILRYRLQQLLPLANTYPLTWEILWSRLSGASYLTRLRMNRRALSARQALEGSDPLVREAATEPGAAIRPSWSGASAASRWCIVAGAALLCAVAFGALHGWLTYWNPIDWLNIVLLAIWAALVGALIGLAGRLASLPGSRRYCLIGLLAALVFVYSEWVAWLAGFLGEVVLAPNELFKMITNLAVLAEWISIGSGEGSRGDRYLLWGLWGADLIIVSGVIILAAWVYGLSDREYRLAAAPDSV